MDKEFSMTAAPSSIRDAEALNEAFPSLGLEQRLRLAAGLGRRSVFTTSLGKEDQVIAAAIALGRIGIDIATLNTGRLFAETEALIAETEKRFAITIRQFHPDPERVRKYVEAHGENGFYDSIANRHACCAIRKLEPLARALAEADVWVTGLRRSQSENRATVPFAEWDEERKLFKVNPLADWDGKRIDAYIKWNRVPVSPLHDRGYPSIGCEPCTRAVKPGEPERAGRWWWEQDQKRECGLHVAGAQDGEIAA